MTTTRIPIRTVYDGSNNPVGLAEFQIGEAVPITNGGTAANTVADARINLEVDDSNIRSLFSVSGGGSYDSSTGVITIDATDLTPFARTVDLTTANVTEVTNLYFTNARADLRVGPAFDAANTAIEGVSINAGAISTLQGVTISQATAITNAHNQANVATVNASSAFNQANIATVNASSAFDAANTKTVAADLTTANVVEVTNLYYTDVRAFANLTSASTSSLQEGTNLYFTNARAVAALEGVAVSIGEATITGNLVVLGNVVEFNTETLVVEDKNIVLANGAPSAAAADNSGITIDGADATLLYRSENDEWVFNKDLEVEGSIDASGTITSPFFYSESDAVLKENIKPIKNPLNKVLNLFGVSFSWKSNKQKSIGVIAQEVEKIVPEIVSQSSVGTKTVSYDSLIPLLIEAIKEQQKQIEELKAKVK